MKPTYNFERKMPKMQTKLPYSEQEADMTRSMYLTRQEAAQYLNVPPRWLANNAKRGPRYIKIGGLVRYTVEALDSFMTAHQGKHQ